MKKILLIILFVVLFVLGFAGTGALKYFYKKHENTKLELQECKIFLESVKVDEVLKEELTVCRNTVSSCEERFSQCIYIARYLYKQNADLKGEKNVK